MAASRKAVEFFYDVVSPYTWFAFEVLCRYKGRWNMDLKLKPFFLGGIMKEAGNQPPAMVPNKGVYMAKEMKHLAKYYDVPLVRPSDFGSVMFGTLPAQRFLTAVDLMDSNYTEAVSRELWHRIWSRDEDITKPESLAQAAQKAGLKEDQIKECLAQLKSAAVKDRLKQYTDEAMSYGAFGSPTIIAHVGSKPEMVFGSDRFPILADILGEKWEGPVPGKNKL